MKLFATVKELGMQDNKYNVDDNRLSESGLNLNCSVDLSHLFWNFDSTTSKSVSGSVASRVVGPLGVSRLDVILGRGQWRGRRSRLEIEAVPEPY